MFCRAVLSLTPFGGQMFMKKIEFFNEIGHYVAKDEQSHRLKYPYAFKVPQYSEPDAIST
jgi:hypothetical protein